MLKYAAKRLAYLLPVMMLVAVMVFLLFYVMPGDPAINMAGENASNEDIERIREAMGLSKPVVTRFGIWLWGLLHGDLGRSVFTGIPVTRLIAQRLEPTISLALTALVLSVAIAVPLGVAAAWRAGSAFDRLVMGGAVVGFSMPAFFIGYFLVLVFSVSLEWLPVQGFESISSGLIPFAERMILPSVTVSIVVIALLARVTRTTMMEVLVQDYIRTAHAKGVAPVRVLGIHALKNAAVPIVTVVGLVTASLIGGVIVTETVFAIPGLGALTVDAITRRDYPVIQGVVLLFSASYVLINLVVDLSYRLFDPRIKY